MPADFAVDYDDGYELLMETGKDRTRQNPGQPGKARLYGEIVSAEDKGESPAQLFAVFERQRSSLSKHISGRFSEDSGAFIAAMTTGDTSQLSDGLRDAVNSTGLVHILRKVLQENNLLGQKGRLLYNSCDTLLPSANGMYFRWCFIPIVLLIEFRFHESIEYT